VEAHAQEFDEFGSWFRLRINSRPLSRSTPVRSFSFPA